MSHSLIISILDVSAQRTNERTMVCQSRQYQSVNSILNFHAHIIREPAHVQFNFISLKFKKDKCFLIHVKT